MYKMLSAWLRMCNNTDGLHVTSHQFDKVKHEISKRNTLYLQNSRTLESKKHQSELIKTYKWWNNGKINTRSSSCPGDGWVEGRYCGHPLKKDLHKQFPKKKGPPFGNIPWNKGKTYKAKPASEERKHKISAALKGKVGTMLGKKFTEEHKNNIRNALLGKIGHKQSEETKRIIGEASKGRTFWNNGVEMKFVKDCPGEGWVKGRLKK